MEIVAAFALTGSATMTWVALRLWSHKIVAPTLIYLGSALTVSAIYRWSVVFGGYSSSELDLLGISVTQVGIILVMVAGQRFHTAARLAPADETNITLRMQLAADELAASAAIAGALLAQKADAAGEALARSTEEAGDILAHKAEEAGVALMAKVMALGKDGG